MKNRIRNLYNIDPISIVKINDKCYKILSKESTFILKNVENLKNENIYTRLEISKVPLFHLPLKSNNERYVEEINHQYYILSYFLKDNIDSYIDKKMNLYIKAISFLHQNTILPLKVNDGYFKESIDYLTNKILITKEKIDERITLIERMDYHSPSDWYYISIYHIFNDAISNANKYLDLLNEEFKTLQSIELSLTYQNYQNEHILLKEERIVSLEKMSYAPPIYDLVDFVEKNYNQNIDISKYIEQYFNLNSLNLYYKYWLLALLFVPKIEKDSDDLKDIESLYLSLNYLKVVEHIKLSLLQTESE